MKEPSYSYDWPEPERPPQYKFPESTSFNEYLDLYRDRKDINEQVRDMDFDVSIESQM